MADSTALTVADVMNAAALLADVPKVGIYSHRYFLLDRTVTFTAEDGERFHIAHPAFWDRVEAEVLNSAPLIVAKGALGRTLYGLPLIDLDANDAERARVSKAILEAALRSDPPSWPWRPPA